jgi:probable HAF family extracellular repeat protein
LEERVAQIGNVPHEDEMRLAPQEAERCKGREQPVVRGFHLGSNVMSHRYGTVLIVLALAFSGTGFASAAPPSYTAIALGTIPGYSYECDPQAINNEGQVVGYCESNSGTGQFSHAFLYANGGMTDLGTLGGAGSDALGINNLGQAVGWAQTTSGASHAFLWTGGTMTDIGSLPGATEMVATAINNSGQICGYAIVGGHVHAFLDSGGQLSDLGVLPGPGMTSSATALNNNGQVVGYSYSGTNTRDAVLWSGGPITDLGNLGFPSSAAEAINDEGQIVGYLVTNSNAGETITDAFLDIGGTMEDLGNLPGGRDSDAVGINNNGVIVGTAVNGQADADGFVYSDSVMTDLQTLMPQGWYIWSVEGINDCGQIIGYGKDPIGTTAFLLTPVPEPSTITLLLASAACLLGYAWRWRKRNS